MRSPKVSPFFWSWFRCSAMPPKNQTFLAIFSLHHMLRTSWLQYGCHSSGLYIHIPGMGKSNASDLYLAGHIAALNNVCFVTRKKRHKLTIEWITLSVRPIWGVYSLLSSHGLRRDFLIEQRLLLLCSHLSVIK